MIPVDTVRLEVAISEVVHNPVITDDEALVWHPENSTIQRRTGGQSFMACTVGLFSDYDRQFRQALDTYKQLKVNSIPMALRSAGMVELDRALEEFSTVGHGRITKRNLANIWRAIDRTNGLPLARSLVPGADPTSRMLS